MALSIALVIGVALGPAKQSYLLQASQMQALSFAVHIPLVCFGIAFPVMIMLPEGLYLRRVTALQDTGQRWTKIMAALFARGGDHGHDPQLRDGSAVAELHRDIRQRLWTGICDRGVLLLHRGDFLGIYVYGWDRLSPKVICCAAIPIVLAGFVGSLMVISVNAWMQHPSGFRLRPAEAVDVHPLKALFDNSFLWHELIHMYIAAYIVTGFLLASPMRSGACAANGAAMSARHLRFR